MSGLGAPHRRVSCRAQPKNWIERFEGWFRDEATTGEWEVICLDCGDDQGPYSEQSAAVQAVRGPYDTFAAAQGAAERHSGSITPGA